METQSNYNSGPNQKGKANMITWSKFTELIPKKYINIDCDKTEMVKQGIDHSLFIFGNCGVGKTVLMASIAKELIKSRKRVEWISYPEFIMTLQNLYKKEGEETPFEIAEKIATFSGCLCIDDLGAEKMTDFVKQITYYIINCREQEILHTIITSNYSLDEIKEQIDRRISSRIAGMCEYIKLEGKDRRRFRK